MPPRGVKKGTKRARQYEHIKDSLERARHGESRTASRTSTRDISSGRHGGLRSGTDREKGRTKAQLYNEAKHMGVEGRSKMTKAQLERAVDTKK